MDLLIGATYIVDFMITKCNFSRKFKRGAYINIVETSCLYKYIQLDNTLSHWFRPVIVAK